MTISFSIVTVSFNQGSYLARCLASVQGQDYANYEHIVVDPGSSDGSRDLLANCDCEKLRLVFDNDDGPADGLNHGLAILNGTWMLYLNADDELAPGALASLSTYIERNPDAEVIIGNGWLIDKDGEPKRALRSDKFHPLLYALRQGVIVQQASAYRTRLFDTGLKFNASNRYNWDAELIFDLRERNAHFEYINTIIGYFREQPFSITSNSKYSKDVADANRVLRRRGAGNMPLSVMNALALPLLVPKAMRSSLWRRTSASKFPGLVHITPELRSM